MRLNCSFVNGRKIRDLSFQFSRDVLEAWRPQTSIMNCDDSVFMQHSISPFCDAKMSFSESMSFSSGGDATQFSSNKHLAPGKNHMGRTSLDHNGGDITGSDESSDDDEQFQSIDMEALRQRGKGVYLCPKGHRCDKGGVDKDGNLVIFDRNSSFAYVPVFTRISSFQRMLEKSIWPDKLGLDNTVTSIVNHGGVTCRVAQTPPRSGSLLVVTD